MNIENAKMWCGIAGNIVDSLIISGKWSFLVGFFTTEIDCVWSQYYIIFNIYFIVLIHLCFVYDGVACGAQWWHTSQVMAEVTPNNNNYYYCKMILYTLYFHTLTGASTIELPTYIYVRTFITLIQMLAIILMYGEWSFEWISTNHNYYKNYLCKCKISKNIYKMDNNNRIVVFSF